MTYREAQETDIEQLAQVRLSVTENVLSNPGRITPGDYKMFLTQRGKGWVCEAGGSIVGFAIADLQAHNIWALFIRPGWEGRGIGKRLQALMLDWYFAQTHQTVWLGTAPHTRAEGFYRHSGWTATGLQPNGEMRFEMSFENWPAQ